MSQIQQDNCMIASNFILGVDPMNSVEVVTCFYDAFKGRNGAKMASFYSDEVEFTDPVFPLLKGEEAKSMWRMLCSRSIDLRLDYKVISSTGNDVQVAWDALYTFGVTGRKVHNRVATIIAVEGDKIIRHTDNFDFYKWASQALGPLGYFFGWTSFLRKRVQARAASTLVQFIEQQGPS